MFGSSRQGGERGRGKRERWKGTLKGEGWMNEKEEEKRKRNWEGGGKEKEYRIFERTIREEGERRRRKKDEMF